MCRCYSFLQTYVKCNLWLVWQARCWGYALTAISVWGKFEKYYYWYCYYYYYYYYGSCYRNFYYSLIWELNVCLKHFLFPFCFTRVEYTLPWYVNQVTAACHEGNKLLYLILFYTCLILYRRGRSTGSLAPAMRTFIVLCFFKMTCLWFQLM